MVGGSEIVRLLLCLWACLRVTDCLVIHKNDGANPCFTKTDGKYCTRNSFEYMVCKNHKASYVSCGDNLYDPHTQTCVTSSKVDARNYCRYRPNGNYNWPWNCHKYVTCSNHYYYPFNCSTPDLVYDSTSDRCEHPEKVQCKEIKELGVDNPCNKLPDGQYSFGNIFRYATCMQGKTTYTNCPQHSIYDPSLQGCNSITHYSEYDFCKDRSTLNWQNPWNCHTYIACVYQKSHFMKCAKPELVFNPDENRCVDPSKYACHEEKENVSTSSHDLIVQKETNPCSDKTDGKYVTRDIFKYMQCTNHVASYVECVSQEFDPTSKSCVDYKQLSRDTFCHGRPNSNYIDPWNCHKFITCSNEHKYIFNCSTPDLVYDPISDRCQHPEKAVCKQINDPCALKPDGKYATRDIFQYMICKDGVSTFISCEDDVYNPCSQTCESPSDVTEENFCKCRPNENFMDPWSCHSFVICSNHLFNLFNCSTPDLVYDATTDQCEHPEKVKCKQINELTHIADNEKTDPCKSKADGKYCTRNSFEYMECKDHKASYVSCGDNLYDPHTQTCVTSSKVDAKNYCRYRPNGNYNWPWNCHKYVTCSNHYYYPFNCSTPDLVYDPTTDACEHPQKMKCKEIKKLTHIADNEKTDPCKSKADGKYCTRNSFEYMECKDHKASYVSCGDNLYDPHTQTCVTSSKVDARNYCRYRPNGNYNWPWNCHKYVTCSNHYYYPFNCSTPDLVYDPTTDKCEHPQKMKCKEIKGYIKFEPKRSSSTQMCSRFGVGFYAVRDVTKIKVCVFGKSFHLRCSSDSIFIPGKNTCTQLKDVNHYEFCRNRRNSNYANPWDQNSFITCYNDNMLVKRCTENFVYNPDADICQSFSRDLIRHSGPSEVLSDIMGGETIQVVVM